MSNTKRVRKSKYDFDKINSLKASQFSDYYKDYEKNKNYLQRIRDAEDMFEKDKRPKLDFETYFRDRLVDEDGFYPVQRLDEKGRFDRYDLYNAKNIADRIFNRGLTAEQLSREDLSNLGDIDAIRETFGPTFEGWEKVYKEGLSKNLFNAALKGKTKEEILNELVDKGKGLPDRLSKMIDAPFKFQQLGIYNDLLKGFGYDPSTGEFDPEAYDNYIARYEEDEDGNKIPITRKESRDIAIKKIEDQIAQLQQEKIASEKFNDRMSDEGSFPNVYNPTSGLSVNEQYSGDTYDQRIKALQDQINEINDVKTNQLSNVERIKSGTPKYGYNNIMTGLQAAGRPVKTISADGPGEEFMFYPKPDLTMAERISQLQNVSPLKDISKEDILEQYNKAKEYQRKNPVGGGLASTLTKILHPYDYLAHKLQGTTMLEDTGLGLSQKFNNPLINAIDFSTYALPGVAMVRGAQMLGDTGRGIRDSLKYSKNESDLVKNLGMNALGLVAGTSLLKPLGKGFLRPMGAKEGARRGYDPNFQIIPKRGQSSVVLRPGYDDLKTINLPGNRTIQYGNPYKQIQRNIAQSTRPATPQQVQAAKNFDKYGQQYIDDLTRQQTQMSPFITNTFAPTNRAYDKFLLQPYFAKQFIFNEDLYDKDVLRNEFNQESVVNKNMDLEPTSKKTKNMKKISKYSQGGKLTKARRGLSMVTSPLRRTPITIRDIKNNLSTYFPYLKPYDQIVNLSPESLSRLNSLKDMAKSLTYHGVPGAADLVDMAKSPGIKALFDGDISLDREALQKYRKPYQDLTPREMQEVQDIVTQQISRSAGKAFKVRKSVQSVTDILQRLKADTREKGKLSYNDVRYIFDGFKGGRGLFEAGRMLNTARARSRNSNGEIDMPKFIRTLEEQLETIKRDKPHYFSNELQLPGSKKLRDYGDKGFRQLITDLESGGLDSMQYRGQFTLADFLDGNQPFGTFFDPSTGKTPEYNLGEFYDALDLRKFNTFTQSNDFADSRDMILSSKMKFNEGAHRASPLSVMVNDINLSADSYPLQTFNNLYNIARQVDPRDPSNPGLIPNPIFLGYYPLNTMDFTSQIFKKKRNALQQAYQHPYPADIARMISGITEKGPKIRASVLAGDLKKKYDKFGIPEEERLPLMMSGNDARTIFAPQFGIAKDPRIFVPPEERYMYKSGGIPTAQAGTAGVAATTPIPSITPDPVNPVPEDPNYAGIDFSALTPEQAAIAQSKEFRMDPRAFIGQVPFSVRRQQRRANKKLMEPGMGVYGIPVVGTTPFDSKLNLKLHKKDQLIDAQREADRNSGTVSNYNPGMKGPKMGNSAVQNFFHNLTHFDPAEKREKSHNRFWGNKRIKEDGGYIEAELTEKEILDLAKQGFIIEDM